MKRFGNWTVLALVGSVAACGGRVIDSDPELEQQLEGRYESESTPADSDIMPLAPVPVVDDEVDEVVAIDDEIIEDSASEPPPSSGILVPGGSFAMGRSWTGTDAFSAGARHEAPEHEVTVSSFYLDEHEVTVGRFRRFVHAYDGTAPAAGAGAHPAVEGSGWDPAWNAHLPSSQSELRDEIWCTTIPNWTDAPGANESAAMNCVSWYVAFAFCIWDDGRLPTEAEFEYAAAGGDENRLYPWGAAEPDADLANFNYQNEQYQHLLPVGSTSAGNGRWGHADLGGGMWEWVFDRFALDWHSEGGAECVDCANVDGGQQRGKRGGSWNFGPERLRAADRNCEPPDMVAHNMGFRCAWSE